MKKLISLAAAAGLCLSVLSLLSSADNPNMINYMEMTLKATESPQRLEVIFALKEPIDLSQEKADIIYEYYKDEEVVLRKDKSWSGYLNTYENYPEGEIKYSSGAANDQYSNAVPADKIYTSVKTSERLDVAQVSSVKITVLRSNGSGESIMIYADGTTSAYEKIEVPVHLADKQTGVQLDASTAELPTDATLQVERLNDTDYKEELEQITNHTITKFLTYRFVLSADGKEIEPTGKVSVRIPIPDHFDRTHLMVFNLSQSENNQYPVTVNTIDGTDYAAFETDHFSIYILAEAYPAEAEEPPTSEPETPEIEQTSPVTGTTNHLSFLIFLNTVSLAILILVITAKKAKWF